MVPDLQKLSFFLEGQQTEISKEYILKTIFESSVRNDLTSLG